VRVQLRATDDTGAVALMVAGATIVLAILVAFSTDLGMAYTSKRQMQNASDSAVLASAGVYASSRATCADLLSAIGTSARSKADSIAASNYAGADTTAYDDTCLSSKVLQTHYVMQDTSGPFFGGVAGVHSIGTRSEATATVSVPPTLSGLKPYMICLADALSLRDTPGQPVQVFYFPSCGNAPGNWYTVECPPPDDGNGNSVLTTNTAEGCTSPINAVDTSAAAGDAAGITALLRAACNTEPRQSDGMLGCLVGDTGNDMTSGNVSDAWNALVGQEIELPIFDPASFHSRGSHTWYPVKGFLSATVCGYHWQSASGSKSLVQNTGVCAGAVAPTSPTQDNWMLLKYQSVGFGGSSNPPICALGDPTCDFGRQVLLTK
jgi:Flp pilus assembly protein TadG